MNQVAAAEIPVGHKLAVNEDNTIRFFSGGTEEVLRLDKDGMTYKGHRIEDAGEAHRAFVEAMNAISNQRTL